MKIFFAILFLTIATIGYSQTTIVKSNKVVTENGMRFYIHHVEVGQTIYSLCKAYAVSQEDILKYNPELSAGLKLNQDIKIPVTIETSSITIAPPDTIPPQEFGFIFHRVAAGETLYRIMKNYEINLEELSKYNPGLSANLHIGQFIKIPKPETIVAKKAENQFDSLITYTVKRRDTYSKLERKFRINQEALEQLNPILKEIGLQTDMLIKIPYAPDIEANDLNAVIIYKPDSIEQPSPEKIVETIGCEAEKAKSVTYKIGIMIPFYSQRESDIRVDNEYFMKSADNYIAFRYIQYYEGLLLAIDSMQNRGFKAEVYVYDTKADSNVTQRLINNPEFQELDLIFGPFFARNLKYIVPAAAKNNTKVVSPFSSGTGLNSYSNLFIIESSDKSLWHQGFKYAHDSLPSSHIYLLHNGSTAEVAEMNLIRDQFFVFSDDSSKFHVYNYKDAGFKNLLANLKKDRANIIINLVNDEAYISSFVRQLNQISEGTHIVLMGTEDHWSKFKTLEEEYLVNLHLTLLSNSFIDYRQPSVQNFIQLFQEKYKTDPQMIAFKGFDQGMYFLNIMYHYGANFTPCIKDFNFEGVQNDFNFIKSGLGKWMNENGCIYQYYDYQLVDKKKAVQIIYDPENKESIDTKPDTNLNPR